MSVLHKSLKELHQAIAKKELKVTEIVQASIDRIKQVEPHVQAFLRIEEEVALSQAKQLDEQYSQNSEMGLLAGLPVGIKDNINTKGIITTAGSKILNNYEPLFNATVIEKLHVSEAVIIGKTNMDEFAMGSSTENSAYQKTYNPWNKDHVPGGSSGGSAAAVAAGEVYFALGSDTGGSVRQPAAYCGVVGLKPTYGLVSRFGLISYASSLDQIGPITRTVQDSAYVLQSIAGHDSLDSTSAKVDIPDYLSALTGDVNGLRIGVPKEYLGEGLDSGVKEKLMEALNVLEKLGATWEEVSLPHSDYAISAYYLIAPAEASSNLARYDGIRFGHRSSSAQSLIDLYKETRSEGFGEEVKRRIMLGTYALSSGYYDAYYLKAQKARTLIKQDFENVYKQYDIIIGPTAPTTAFKFGAAKNPLSMYLNDIYTIPVNLAGLPAISVPCGFVDGLPVGLQMIGKPFEEQTLLRVAHAFEQNTEHHHAQPQFV